jgi:hypothetical protein
MMRNKIEAEKTDRLGAALESTNENSIMISEGGDHHDES